MLLFGDCFRMYCFHVVLFLYVFFFKQKTAYEIGTGDWSSDVCSSDLKPVNSSPFEGNRLPTNSTK